jgi:Fanconi anemia group M protein
MSFENIFQKSEKEIKGKQLPKPKIIVDTREKQSLIVSELVHQGAETEFKQLSIGDYIIKNTVIERKTINDFISSMLNKRMIRQLQNMQPLKSKLLIIEGIDEYELYHEESGVNENAIRGFLLSIVLNFQVPIIYTKDYEDTAKFLIVLAKKPDKEREMGINDKPKPRNVKEQLQYLIEGFPGIGPKTARKLLEEFKTIKNIINTPIEDLEKFIGKKGEAFKLAERVYRE